MQLSRLMPSKSKSKILIYLFGSLGDTLVAIPAMRAVRRHFHDAELIVLQNIHSSENIVKTEQVIPEELVDGYIGYETQPGILGKFINFYRLWRDLRRNDFQAAVYLVISERPERSVRRDKIFFRLCGIRRLIGFHSFSEEQLYPRDSRRRPALTENEAVRKLKRLQIDGIEILPEDDLQLPLLKFSKGEVETVKKKLANRRKKADSRLISIAPGCKTEANIWSLENFIEIGRRLLNEGNYEVVIVGGKAEYAAGEKMISSMDGGINTAGEFSVHESGALLSLCDFHIGLDTGTTHLAAMVGTPCFALYGERNNPGHWFPLGDGHTIVFHPVKCAGCRLQACSLLDHPCMTEINVESVWRHLQDFIRNQKRSKNASEINVIAV
jgi:heptosyltransferase-3